MNEKLFEVGETLVCRTHSQRADGLSEINAGDTVKVLNAFTFTFDGRQIQDLTVQHKNDAPISVLTDYVKFRRVKTEVAP